VGSKLFIGNLAYSVTEGALTEKLSEFGQVESVKIITDRDTGHSKGFGFVEMGSAAEANAAIGGLNGQDMDGRAIKVSEAKPQQSGSRGGRGRY